MFIIEALSKRGPSEVILMNCAVGGIYLLENAQFISVRIAFVCQRRFVRVVGMIVCVRVCLKYVCVFLWGYRVVLRIVMGEVGGLVAERLCDNNIFTWVE